MSPGGSSHSTADAGQSAWNHAGKSTERSQGRCSQRSASGSPATPPAAPDLIYFRQGGDAQIPATTEDHRVVVVTPDGKVELSRESIRKLVPGFWPPHEWAERRRNALAGGFDARFAASGGLSKTA